VSQQWLTTDGKVRKGAYGLYSRDPIGEAVMAGLSR
jgi:hypothetical protein